MPTPESQRTRKQAVVVIHGIGGQRPMGAFPYMGGLEAAGKPVSLRVGSNGRWQGGELLNGGCVHISNSTISASKRCRLSRSTQSTDLFVAVSAEHTLRSGL